MLCAKSYKTSSGEELIMWISDAGQSIPSPAYLGRFQNMAVFQPTKVDNSQV
jgi:hypothetical protein